MEKERRYVNISELRTTLDSARGPIIDGHAAVFNQPSLEIFGVPGWREVIRPGAFSKVIQTDDVRALINHNDDKLIGRVSNRTLDLEEDAIGLRARIYPPDTSETRDLLVLIRGGYITQMSFGFRMNDEGQRIDHANKIREINEISALYDVSPVTLPAYPQTDVGLRSLFQAEIDPSALLVHSDKVGAEFQQRMKEREEFLARRTPPVNPLDFSEIIKNARKTSVF